jgi:hypothetical protein
MYTGKEKQNDRLIYSWQEFRCWKTSLYYSKFIIFLGIPIFVNFVDNVKPQNSITICHHIYIYTDYSRGSTNLHNFENSFCPRTTKICIHKFKWIHNTTKAVHGFLFMDIIVSVTSLMALPQIFTSIDWVPTQLPKAEVSLIISNILVQK